MALTPQEQAEWNDNRQPMIIGVLSFLLVLSNGTTIARTYAAIRLRSFGADDYCMIVACILSDAVIAAMLSAVSLGLGHHEFRVLADDPTPPVRLAKIFEIIWFYAVLNGFCFLTIKLSILLFYRRLFWVSNWFKTLFWINSAYALLWTTGSTFFYIFQCSPTNYYWTRAGAVVPNGPVHAPAGGHCDPALSGTATPIFLNTFGDLFILLIPWPIILQMRMTNRQRLELLALFSIGLTATASGFVRFAYVFIPDIGSDLTYSACQFLLWSNIEEVFGIVCANLPKIASFRNSLKKQNGGLNGQGAVNGQRQNAMVISDEQLVTPGSKQSRPGGSSSSEGPYDMKGGFSYGRDGLSFGKAT